MTTPTTPTAPTTPITQCTTCPLYAKAADARDEAGLPYFGVCRGTGRFITYLAAQKLPSSALCPIGGDARRATDIVAATGHSIADVLPVETAGERNPFGQIYLATQGLLGVATSVTDQPDSCKRCVFFQPKEHGTPGTPTARYDSCAKKGTLITPGTRAATAAACSVGVAGAHAKTTPILLAPYVATSTTSTEPVPAPGAPLPWSSPDSDPAADVRAYIAGAGAAGVEESTLDSLMASLVPTAADIDPRALGRFTYIATDDDEASAPVTAIPTADTVAAASTAISAARRGLRAVPTRVSRTGFICDAAEYDLSAIVATMPGGVLPVGAMGVVAVRTTSQPYRVVWLPRYDESIYDQFQLADVPVDDPDLYFDHSDLMYDMAVGYASDHVTALWGDAGVGKTEGVENIARLTRQPFCRVSIKWATQVEDLMGRWTLRSGDMEWMDGRFTKAWREGYVICVDEPNTGKDEVWQALRAPFDGAKTLVLDEKDGERIHRHPAGRVYTAMNPSWDARFAGTRPISDADVDRMGHVSVGYPDREVETKILVARCAWIEEAQREVMLNVARDVRAAVSERTIRISFGPRKMIRWAEAARFMPMLPAFRQAVTNWMQPEEARILNDIADTYIS